MTHKLTGKQFKLKHPFTKFITTDDMFDDNYMLFYKYSYFKKELNNNDTKYKYDIEILDDADVICEENLFKCNRFKRSNKVSLTDFRKYRPDLAKKKCKYWQYSEQEVFEDLIIKDIEIDYRRFTNLDDCSRTYNVSLYTMSRNGTALAFVPIDIQDEQLVTVAVEDNWRALEFVRDDLKTLKISMTAFKKCWHVYKHFKEEHKSKELQKIVDENYSKEYAYQFKQGNKIVISN